MGQVFSAGEKPDERPSLLRHVVADGSAQYRIAGLERVKDCALCYRTLHVERYLGIDVRQCSQMLRQFDSDHINYLSVWASTESTGGRSRTMAIQLSPASAEA